ncbi:pilus assembly protein PilB [Nostoc sp. 106C]|uniref:GspE/PulE/PilB domain-containing protein n=1 Tax=Nostoc sp. 106C TaxID=1932667 RepID=UPI000A38C90D|nr:pilus assembly protein PilB [Nostoc sp. 106C]OUL31599.1 pilus assembly protein PilB [Nostoc sp. 106C]
MLSSEGKLTDNEEIEPPMPDETPLKGKLECNNSKESPSDREHIFSLIDSLLSLEACLYHQILPLQLKGNQLLLGMVDPQDSEALDYVSRILSSIDYIMVTEAIEGDIHHATLSAYLNYKNRYPSDAKQNYQPKVDSTSKNRTVSLSDQLNSSATTYSELNLQPSLIEPQTEILPASISQADLSSIPDSNSLSGSLTATSADRSQEEQTTEVVLPSNLTVLPVQIPDTLSSIEVLPTLPSKKLLEELLARVLLGGIGRLYLERQYDQGRILWSDNGVLQSVIENLPLAVFQEVINEFKQFAGLPIATFPEPKQVEKEWLYQNNSLLLRLRVMPGIYGEEATLQVLRGAALKFYQQQQLNRLSHDTLVMAKQLSFKLHELEQRLLFTPSLQSEQLKAMVALTQLVDNLDKHLNVLAGESQLPKNSK